VINWFIRGLIPHARNERSITSMNRKRSLYLLKFVRRPDKLKLNCSFSLQFQIQIREACSTHKTVENSHEILVGQLEGKNRLGSSPI